MKLIIFGATGRTGKHIVKQALQQGYRITAFVLNPYELNISHSLLDIIMGDVLDYEKVKEAMRGHHIVLSALNFENVNDMKTGINNIIRAMMELNIKRLIAVDGMGILQSTPDKMIFQCDNFPECNKEQTLAHYEIYEELKKSNLDFTLICPPFMLDGEKTEKYLVKAEYHPTGDSVYTGDVAHFILEELKNNLFNRMRVGICNNNDTAE
jgi:putative NADH-flavin reductase